MSKENIRVRANVAIIKDERILLVPHILDNDKKIWYLPGGKVEFGETLEQAAKRETLEETGLEVELRGMVDTYELIEPEKPWHSISIIYEGEIIGGKLKAENHPIYGVKEPKWFSSGQVKKLQCRPSGIIKNLVNKKDQI